MEIIYLIMKTKFILCISLLLSITQNNSYGQSSDEETLRHIKEVEWPKAYREQDTVLLDKILAEEFKMISSDGEYSTKKEQIQYIKTHKPHYTSFKFEIKRLEIFENGTAIVSG